MRTMDVAEGYFAAWNSRDPGAVAATFVEGGTYADPATGAPLSGLAIVGYVQGILTIFPNLSFDVVSEQDLGNGRVAAQWIMRGTNTGPLPGGPPLGRSIALPGADFIQIEGDGVRSVDGYFDQKTMLEQMGLAVTPMPAEAIGPFSFGSGVHARES